MSGTRVDAVPARGHNPDVTDGQMTGRKQDEKGGLEPQNAGRNLMLRSRGARQASATPNTGENIPGRVPITASHRGCQLAARISA
jgi:hypothetical protein